MDESYRPTRKLEPEEALEITDVATSYLEDHPDWQAPQASAYRQGWLDAAQFIFDLIEPRRSRVLPATLCLTWQTLVIMHDVALKEDDLERALRYSLAIGDFAQLIQAQGEPLPAVRD